MKRYIIICITVAIFSISLALIFAPSFEIKVKDFSNFSIIKKSDSESEIKNLKKKIRKYQETINNFENSKKSCSIECDYLEKIINSDLSYKEFKRVLNIDIKINRMSDDDLNNFLRKK